MAKDGEARRPKPKKYYIVKIRRQTGDPELAAVRANSLPQVFFLAAQKYTDPLGTNQLKGIEILVEDAEFLNG